MTNYLNTAMLSAGANCFGALLEIEQNMSQAEINALIASQSIMAMQPLLVTGTQNLYDAQATDTLISGIIGGVGQIAGGVAQLGLTVKGASEGQAEFNKPIEPAELQVTQEVVPAAKIGQAPAAAAAVDAANANQAPAPGEAPAKVAASENATSETREQTDADKQKAARTAQKKADSDLKIKEDRRSAAVQKYQAYGQLSSTILNGFGTVGRGPTDMFATQHQGEAAALGTVAQGNQAAQGSFTALTQTYKDAFTNAAQVLAGIVSAQNH